MSDSAIRKLIDGQSREEWRAALLEVKTHITESRLVNEPYGYFTPSVLWITLLVLLYGGTTLLNQAGLPGQVVYSAIARPTIVLGMIGAVLFAAFTGLSVPQQKLKKHALGVSIALFGLAYTYTYIANPSDANQLLEFLIRTAGLSDSLAVLIFLVVLLVTTGVALGVLSLVVTEMVLIARLVKQWAQQESKDVESNIEE